MCVVDVSICVAPILFADPPCDWSVPCIKRNKDVLISVWQPVLLPSKVTNLFFWLSDPQNIFLDNENNQFSGWPNRYVGYEGSADGSQVQNDKKWLVSARCNVNQRCFQKYILARRRSTESDWSVHDVMWSKDVIRSISQLDADRQKVTGQCAI